MQSLVEHRVDAVVRTFVFQVKVSILLPANHGMCCITHVHVSYLNVRSIQIFVRAVISWRAFKKVFLPLRRTQGDPEHPM